MTREVNCMNCMIGRFKDDLCDEKMCEALKRIGESDDFVDIIMLAKELVQCKDCKWYENREVCHNPRYGDGHANYSPPYVDEEYWCKDGERREL